MPYRGDDVHRLCPRCEDASLYAASRGSARALVCRRCGGLFLEPDAARAVASRVIGPYVALAEEATRSPPRPSTSAFTLPCPQCGAVMERVSIAAAGCNVDVCLAHGAWFDRWELQALARAVALAKGDQNPGGALLRALDRG